MRLLLVCVIAALLAPAPAQASRLHAIRVIAVQQFGPDVCGDTLTVPVENGPMLQTDWLAYAHREGDTPPYTGCAIVLRQRHWTSLYLCEVVLHEYGHLSGYRAPEGQEYIGPDGVPDYDHSNDPRSLMWPWMLSYQPQCEQFLPRTHLSHALAAKT